MAVLDQTKYPTLFDLAQQMKNGDGEYINMLTQLHPELQDAPAYEANQGTSHKTTVKTGLPYVVWTKLYEGIPASKGTTQTVVDTLGMVESAAEVDTRYVDIYEKSEQKMSVRAEMANDHVEAMGQEAAQALWYHDSSTAPEKPTGFSPRFSSLSAENGKQIVDGLGVGSDNTSIWLITWGPMASHLIYPKGSSAGMKRKDVGIVTITDANGNRFEVYREKFSWSFGLSVRNWQYVARVANISVGTLTNDGATGSKIINLMTEAYYVHKGRRTSMGKTFWYMNTIATKFLDYQSRLMAGQNALFTWAQVGANGKEVLNFRGIPIRETDAILSTESRVV